MNNKLQISQENKAWSEEVLQKIVTKMSWVSEKSKDKIPYRTDENGTHDDWDGDNKEFPDQGICWWTNGFWPGLMWLMYQVTKEEKYVEVARAAQEKLHKAFTYYYGLHHDVGFMYLIGDVADYRLTGDEKQHNRLIKANAFLMNRYNLNGSFLRAWNSKNWRG